MPIGTSGTAVSASKLEAPTQEELAATHKGAFRSRIGTRVGAPSSKALVKIEDLYGEPMPAARLFTFPTEPSNQNVDLYFTSMGLDTLANYERDAKAGRGLMLSHDYNDLPVGQSYDARLATGPLTAGQRAAWARARRRDPALPQPGQEQTRFFADFYMVRGIHPSRYQSNDDIIASIETRTFRDVSVGFQAERLVCNLCGGEVSGYDCPHIPGVVYQDEENGGAARTCIATVAGGQLLEVSIGFKGATPEANIVPTKTRLVAAQNGRLAQNEIEGIRNLERLLGQRLVDPSVLRRSGRYFLTPSPKKEEVMGGTQTRQTGLATTPHGTGAAKQSGQRGHANARRAAQRSARPASKRWSNYDGYNDLVEYIEAYIDSHFGATTDEILDQVLMQFSDGFFERNGLDRNDIAQAIQDAYAGQALRTVAGEPSRRQPRRHASTKRGYFGDIADTVTTFVLDWLDEHPAETAYVDDLYIELVARFPELRLQDGLAVRDLIETALEEWGQRTARASRRTKPMTHRHSAGKRLPYDIEATIKNWMAEYVAKSGTNETGQVSIDAQALAVAAAGQFGPDQASPEDLLTLAEAVLADYGDTQAQTEVASTEAPAAAPVVPVGAMKARTGTGTGTTVKGKRYFDLWGSPSEVVQTMADHWDEYVSVFDSPSAALAAAQEEADSMGADVVQWLAYSMSEETDSSQLEGGGLDDFVIVTSSGAITARELQAEAERILRSAGYGRKARSSYERSRDGRTVSMSTLLEMRRRAAAIRAARRSRSQSTRKESMHRFTRSRSYRERLAQIEAARAMEERRTAASRHRGNRFPVGVDHAPSNAAETGVWSTQRRRRQTERAALPAKREGAAQPTVPPATGSTQPSQAAQPAQQTGPDLQTVIAQSSSAEAQAIVQQIQGLQQEITATQQGIDAINANISALQGQTDANNDPVDNTAEIQTLQTQLQAEQNRLDSLNTQLAGLMDQLNAINNAASQTGGTPVQAPNAPADNANASTAVTGTNLMRSPDPLRDIRITIARHAPAWKRRLARYGEREVTQDQVQPILDQLNQIIQSLQAVLQAATPPAQPQAQPAQPAPAAGQNTATSRKAQERAEVEAAKAYRQRLIDACVAAKVRALGQSADEERYRRMLGTLDIDALAAEADGLNVAASSILTSSRRVLTDRPAEAVAAYREGHQLSPNVFGEVRKITSRGLTD